VWICNTLTIDDRTHLVPALYEKGSRKLAAITIVLHCSRKLIQWITMIAMITIAEVPEYIRQAEKLLTDAERQDILSYLSAHPKAGDLIEGTGGIRKLRWGRGGRGKSGGVRVIYYYHSELLPLFLLNVFAKNEKANLTKAERNEMRRLVPRLVAGYQKRMPK